MAERGHQAPTPKIRLWRYLPLLEWFAAKSKFGLSLA